MHRFAHGFLFLSLLLSFGCGPSDGRLAVTGTVNHKGTPLKEGIIEFSSGNIRSGASIADGKYEVPRDQGLTPGEYSVSITAGDGRTPVDSPDGIPGPTGANIVSKELIPPEYNVNSKIKAQVSQSGPNKFDYDIP